MELSFAAQLPQLRLQGLEPGLGRGTRLCFDRERLALSGKCLNDIGVIGHRIPGFVIADELVSTNT